MSKTKYAWAMATLAGAALASEAAAESFDRNALEELAGEPITLSATGAPLRVTEAPVNMTIITQEEIVRSGAIDIPGILERLASVDVMRTSRSMADVSIRGYNATMSPRLLVLLNGRQVYFDHYGMTNWNAIPVQLPEIRQIEVVTGPNTALFGFNAVGGVINIITFDTLHDDIDSASGTLGDPDYAAASGVWTQRFNDRLGVRLSAGGLEAAATDTEDAISRLASGVDARDPYSRNVALNVGYNITDSVRADAEATWSRSDRQGHFAGTLLAERFETTSAKVAVSAETSAGLINAQVYVNTLDNGNLTVAGLTEQENTTLVAMGSIVAKPRPAHTVRAGVEYRRNELEQGYGEMLGYDVYALSGMWNWQISDRLALTSAVRVDALELERSGPQVSPSFPMTNADYDRELTEPSYNLGLVYQATSVDSIRFAAARGVGSPSLNELGVQQEVNFPPLTIFAAGDPDISPTLVDNVELSWDRRLPSLSGRLHASVFWQRTEDLTALGGTIIPVDMTTILASAGNIGDSEMVGFEAGIEGQADRLRWRAQYSWRSIDDALTATPVNYEEGSPEQVAAIGLLWTGDRWELGADARYTSATAQYGLTTVGGGGAPPAIPVLPVDAYVQTNLHVAWLPRPGLRIELSGRDLLEDETQTVGLTPVARSFYLTVSRRFGVN